MDPNALVDRIIDALIDNDFPEAYYNLKDLSDWLAKGGFSPEPKKLLRLLGNMDFKGVDKIHCPKCPRIDY